MGKYELAKADQDYTLALQCVRERIVRVKEHIVGVEEGLGKLKNNLSYLEESLAAYNAALWGLLEDGKRKTRE